MPVPPDEPILVDMYGFGVTQYRLVHSLTAAEYEALAVPIYAPPEPSLPVVDDDYGIDHDPPGRS